MLRMKADHHAMKKLFVLAILSLFMTSCSGAPAQMPDFSLEIIYQEEESSDDSNGQGVSISLADNHVTYEWDYWGYHPNEDFDTHDYHKLTLTDEELEELKLLLIEKNLWQEVYEDKASNLMGDSLYVEFFAAEGPEAVMSTVSGMTWSLEEREGNIESLEFVEAVDDVIDFIEDRIDD